MTRNKLLHYEWDHLHQKPRLFVAYIMSIRLWVCAGGVWGYGYTPQHAYNNWKINEKHHANFLELD